MNIVLRSRFYYSDDLEEKENIEKAYLSKLQRYYSAKITFSDEDFCYVIELEISGLNDILKISNLLDNDLILRKERCSDNTLFMDIYDNKLQNIRKLELIFFKLQKSLKLELIRFLLLHL